MITTIADPTYNPSMPVVHRYWVPEQLAESEQRQFRAGTTRFYLVLQRQTELHAARGRELQAQTDLNKAISEFQRSTGTTLSANNVTVSENCSLTMGPGRPTAWFRPRPLNELGQ